MRFEIPKRGIPDSEVMNTCKNCNNVFTGRYCNQCGEKVAESYDKSLISLLRRFASAFRIRNNRFLKTLWLMFRRPGQLSLHAIFDARVQYLKPITIFLIANLLYFLFTVFETFHSTLQTQMHFVPHSGVVNNMVEDRLESHQLTLSEFKLQYEQQSENMAKLLLVVFVVLVAVSFSLINFSNQLYFLDHFYVSLEFNSMLLLVAHLAIPWSLMLIDGILSLAGAGVGFLLSESFISAVAAVLSLVMIVDLERRVYAQSPKMAWIKAALVLTAIFIALQIYRAILFFLTMWTI